MELTKRQQEGLSLAIKKYKNKEKYVVISGYAGSGKSTLVRFIIEALGVNENEVAYSTFTGKAAEVLRKKGNANSITLHKLLYENVANRDGTFSRFPKPLLEQKIIVVDEISMVPKDMVELLLSHNVFCLFLGDPFQLPPLMADNDNGLLRNPDIFLDEIMRQAAESEIIQLTMKIRNNEPISYFKGKEVMVIPKEELLTGHLTWADMIICATNAQRWEINRQVRKILGFKNPIEENEKVIVKRNYWEYLNPEGEPLVNGSVGTIKDIRNLNFRVSSRVKKIDSHLVSAFKATFHPEIGKPYPTLIYDSNFMFKEVPSISPVIRHLPIYMQCPIPIRMTYGYAITCHSAQGSQWDNVLVIEENFPYDKEEHARWLYTACTRPVSKLVLVR